MSKAIITESNLTAIADAIRAKNGNNTTYTPAEMAAAITAIPTGSSGSGVENSIIERTISGTYSDSTMTTVGRCAFAYATQLEAVSFLQCTTVSSSAFVYCSNLTTATFPECTSVGGSAFYYCSKLTTISFPKCMLIEREAFEYCSKITTTSFPECTTIGSSAFNRC